jgi:hypothetical protein
MFAQRRIQIGCLAAVLLAGGVSTRLFAADTTEVTALEEVLVTAQRRSENL